MTNTLWNELKLVARLHSIRLGKAIRTGLYNGALNSFENIRLSSPLQNVNGFSPVVQPNGRITYYKRN